MSESIPVICDKCRTEGMAGDPLFSAIPDILAFDPVARRAHVNNWTAEHQRAFIAALAITGSPRQAARALGRHAFGAEQLRTARGGKSFADAWDAAMELAREREFARIHANLGNLAATREAELATVGLPAIATHDRAAPVHPDCDYDPDFHTDDYPQYWEAKRIIRERITRGRRILLAGISEDPARRAAWELLVGPVDWERAERLEAQDDEPFADEDQIGGFAQPHNVHNPGFLLTAEAGLIADLTGGPDALDELRRLVAENESAESKADDGVADASPWSRDACPDRPACGETDTFDVRAARDGSSISLEAALPPEEQAAISAHRESLKAEGWTEDDDGSLWSPERDQ